MQTAFILVKGIPSIFMAKLGFSAHTRPSPHQAKDGIGVHRSFNGSFLTFSRERAYPDSGRSHPDACIPGWYCAYFGTYTVDTKTGVWVTHVLSANAPRYLNTDQPRHFTFERRHAYKG